MVPDFGSSCTSMDALRSIYLARDQKTRGGGGQPAPPGRLKNAPVGVGANPHSGDWLKPGPNGAQTRPGSLAIRAPKVSCAGVGSQVAGYAGGSA